MAHQDYVSRPRASGKKNSPYKKAAATQAGLPTKTKLIGLLTLISIIGFSYFLWSIKDNTPTNTKTTNEVLTNEQSNTLPEPPKEKWQYREELETKEVEVGQYEVTNKGPYQMQCGSFKSLKQAQVLKANIAFAGLESIIREPSGKNNTYYRVILGPYERKRSAEKDKHKLKSNNINYCQIWGWR